MNLCPLIIGSRNASLGGTSSRGVVFLVADGGVLPSNEGGEAMFYAVCCGGPSAMDAFWGGSTILSVSCRSSGHIADGGRLPRTQGERELYKQVMELEETRFRETLNQGMEMLESYLIDNFGAEEQRGERLFPGEMAFRLYDTYGFPPWI